jgi:hypothetical protein
MNSERNLKIPTAHDFMRNYNVVASYGYLPPIELLPSDLEDAKGEVMKEWAQLSEALQMEGFDISPSALKD